MRLRQRTVAALYGSNNPPPKNGQMPEGGVMPDESEHTRRILQVLPGRLESCGTHSRDGHFESVGQILLGVPPEAFL